MSRYEKWTKFAGDVGGLDEAQADMVRQDVRYARLMLRRARRCGVASVRSDLMARASAALDRVLAASEADMGRIEELFGTDGAA